MAKNIFGNRPGLENMNLGITECTPVNLEMSLIDENPKNEKIFNMSKIDDLAKYIKEKGFYQPIFRKKMVVTKLLPDIVNIERKN